MPLLLPVFSLSRFGECLKTLRSPFDKLRANGSGVEIAEDFPFVLSLSKHEKPF